jgi:hypothetical protein
MAYAQVEDVQSRLGRDLDESEVIIVESRLNDVELIIRARIPDIDTRALNADYLLRLVMVEAESVIRYIRNPTGIIGESDGNYSYQLNWSTVSGRITLDGADWRLLGVNSSVFQIEANLPVPWAVPAASDGSL